MSDALLLAHSRIMDSDGYLLLGHLVHCYIGTTSSIRHPHIVYRPCINFYIPEAQGLPQISQKNPAPQKNVMGSWPERLLHVEGMTVYQWQPGNRYGSWIEPRYNALCYTWGRYRLPSTPSNIAKCSMKFQGVPWTCFPIDPQYFTVAQLNAVIKRAVASSSDLLQYPLEETDFVWIDQACIDQRRSISRDLEGRRQGVFM